MPGTAVVPALGEALSAIFDGQYDIVSWDPRGSSSYYTQCGRLSNHMNISHLPYPIALALSRVSHLLRRKLTFGRVRQYPESMSPSLPTLPKERWKTSMRRWNTLRRRCPCILSDASGNLLVRTCNTSERARQCVIW